MRPHAASRRIVRVSLETCKSFLVIFFKKEQKKKLLFEKSSKNSCLWGVRGFASARCN